MKLLSLDFETTWTNPVNPKQCRVLEIGCVLYDWENKKPLKMMSEFIFEEDHPKSPPELVELTGITDDMRKEHGIKLKEGLTALNFLMDQCDYVIAHNGNDFDKVVLQSEIERGSFSFVMNKPWIDSKTDIPYPSSVKSHKLTHLCTEVGEFVNPFSHRALFDALAVLKLVRRYDLNEILELAKQPTVKCIASVGYERRELPKARGYYWDGENKYWWKAMKEKQAYLEQDQAPFSIQIRGI